MRMAINAVVLLAIAGPALAECITVPFGVREADVIAVARYAGDRTFTVESIVRAVVEPPAKIVAPPGSYGTYPCGWPEPVRGQTYLVALRRDGFVQHRKLEEAGAERARIDRLHPVTSRAILDVLERYSKGRMSLEAAEEWLSTALVDTRSEASFSAELLRVAESVLSGISYAEPCYGEAMHTLRVKKLPKALRTIRRNVPPVDTEEEFVPRYLDAIKDPVRRAAANDEAVEAFDEIVTTIRTALGPLEEEVDAVPSCDHKKLGQ